MFPNGVYTVLTTPFNKDNSIDYVSLKKLFDIQIQSQVVGLVLMGTTSESPTLNKKEQYDILKNVYKWNSELLKPKYIVLGVGGNDTDKMIKFAKKCVSLCDAFMVTVPCYNKPTQNGIYQHFKSFCSDDILTHKNVMIYNIPSRTGVNMEVSTIIKTCNDFKNIKAIKEATGSINQLIKIRNELPLLKVFSGDDLLLLDFLIHGGHGVISVASNAIPDIIHRIYHNFVNNLHSNTSYQFYEFKLPNFINSLFCETNPIPIKYLLYRIGVFENNILRLPMTSLSKELENNVYDLYKQTVNEFNIV